MKLELWIPNLINVLSALAAVLYFFRGDWRHGLYWIFALGLTCTVTYLLR